MTISHNRQKSFLMASADMEVGMCESSLQRKLVFANRMDATNVISNTEFALQILC